MRVAAIDIGTNSVLLLVAERSGAELVPVVEQAVITRLGEGVDASGAFAPAAIERTLACLADCAAAIARSGAERVDAVGTSAMRDARGGEAFVERARTLLGVAPRVISGDEEARLTFAGALSGLSLPAGPVTVFDIGGGSTEIIVGDADRRTQAAVSLDVGSVRLTERHIRSDPPAASELEAVRQDARATLGRAPLPAPSATLVGVAGTMTTLAAVSAGVAPYNPKRIHGARLTSRELERLGRELAGLPLAARRDVPGLDPGRADVIIAGATLAEELARWAGAESVVISDRGVRWGVALELAGR